MPHLLLALTSIVFAAAATASVEAAPKYKGERGVSTWHYSEPHERVRSRETRRSKAWKRGAYSDRKYGHRKYHSRRYAYPYSAWGPFAMPPGL